MNQKQTKMKWISSIQFDIVSSSSSCDFFSLFLIWPFVVAVVFVINSDNVMCVSGPIFVCGQRLTSDETVYLLQITTSLNPLNLFEFDVKLSRLLFGFDKMCPIESNFISFSLDSLFILFLLEIEVAIIKHT